MSPWHYHQHTMQFRIVIVVRFETPEYPLLTLHCSHEIHPSLGLHKKLHDVDVYIIIVLLCIEGVLYGLT